MRDPAGQAKTVLQVYLERGLKALNELDAGRPDEALILLQSRTAAFHNFRAVDAHARSQALDIADDPDTHSLVRKIRALDQDLGRALSRAKDETQALDVRLSGMRAKIAAFRSGRSDSPQIESKA